MSVFSLECRYGEDKIITAYVKGKGKTKAKDLTDLMKLAYHHGDGVITITDGVSMFHLTFPPEIFGMENLPIGLCRIGESYKKSQVTVVELIPMEENGIGSLHTEKLPTITEELILDVPMIRHIPWDEPVQVAMRVVTSLLFRDFDDGVKHKEIKELTSYDHRYFDIMSNIKVATIEEEMLESVTTGYAKVWKDTIQITRISKAGVKIKMVLMPLKTNI